MGGRDLRRAQLGPVGELLGRNQRPARALPRARGKGLEARTWTLQRHVSRFEHFAAIDWSGAAGERQAGIAVALCDAAGGAPRLARPGHRWSRQEVLDWLLEAMPAETLVGLDLGIALPFADCG